MTRNNLCAPRRSTRSGRDAAVAYRVGISLRCCLCLAVLGLSPGMSPGSEEDELLRNYKIALERYKTLLLNLRVELTFVKHEAEQSEFAYDESGRIGFERNGDDRLLRLVMERIKVHPTPERAGPQRYEKVWLQSKSAAYVFSREDPEKPFTLGDRGAPDSLSHSRASQFYERGLVDPQSSLFTLPIHELFDSPGFAIKNVEIVNDRAEKLAKITFDYRYKIEGVPLHWNGWWTISTRDFAVREYQLLFRDDPGDTCRGVVEYETNPNGVAVPRRITINTSNSSGSRSFHNTRIYNVATYDFATLPVENFRLSRFGYPDDVPSGTSAKAGYFPTCTLFLLMSAACALLALFYRRREKIESDRSAAGRSPRASS